MHSRLTRLRCHVGRSRPLGPRGEDDEEGAIIVIWAIALTAIMGLVAMAVDLGNVAQTKQHAVNAAQAAVLAGVQELAPGTNGVVSDEKANAVSAAEQYLLGNYPISAPKWNSCPKFLPGAASPGSSGAISPFPGADCFGFFTSNASASANGMAVALPPQSVDAIFGRSLGIQSYGIDATAYASLATALSSNVLPFDYSGGPGYQCLKNGSGAPGNGPSTSTDHTGSCNGFTTGSGQFGSLDSPRYRLYAGASPAGGNSSVEETDMVLGVDHPLVDTGASEVCDAVGSPPICPAYNTTAPYDNGNYVAPASGQTETELIPSFFTGGVRSPDGSCTFGPRLNHPDGFIASGRCNNDDGTTGGSIPSNPLTGVPLLSADSFGSHFPLNGQDIAHFLTAQGQALAATCTQPSPSTPIDAGGLGAGNKWRSFDTCFSTALSAYAASPAASAVPLFDSTITGSPRFGKVPVVTGAGNGRDAQRILGFDDVYLDLAFGSSTKVDSLTAWVFPADLVQTTDETGSGGGLPQYNGGPYVANLCAYGVTC